MPESLFEFTDLTLHTAFRDYALQRELRGKGVADTAAKFMRMWVDEALSLIPAGDRDKVQRYLLQQVTAYRALTAPGKNTKKAARQNALANQYRHTLAARIVGALNIYSARGNDAGQYYQKVNRWVQRRIFAVNLHRAGLLPARKALRLRDGKGNMPRLKSAPGSYAESLTDDIVTLTVENWASSAKTPSNPTPKGITGLAGNAFESSLGAVYSRLESYVIADMGRAAARSGFNVSGSR